MCVRLPGLDLGLVHANLALGYPPLASAFGLEPRKVRRSPLSAKRKGPLAACSRLTVALALSFAVVGLLGQRALAGHVRM